MAGAAIAAVGLAVSAKAAKDQKKAQQRQFEAQQKAAKAEEAARNQQAAAQRRQELREERVRRGRILQTSETTGTTASSGQIGAVGAVATQGAVNRGFAGSQASLGQFISEQNQAAASAGLDARNAATLGSLGGTIFSEAGGFNAIKTGFSTVKSKF